ncbi:hypothetical protein QA640_17620 [Bradyrhizobium sp. CB82]|uniref:hypothetical protein n=1 Tax=Bradyrhizobium sp. CB82 TaxID=3039159 RepID=UPI0024B0B888|nr:hypothetical protein [Bradyrhizobium sp. CB82]WFU44103.1 hypothetical protein QA640_17620 [Bradyrhizobium sp. CB82]
MTLVAVWKVQGDRLMAISDSRIVGNHGVLTEHGPKLLPITISCKQPSESGSFDREVFRADVGFAYSGATLSALATHALSNTFLGKLIGSPGAPPPSMADIARFVAGAGAEYMREVGSIAQQGAFFAAVVFGWCHRENRLRVFKLAPRTTTPLSVDFHEKELLEISLERPASQSVIVIGSSPGLFEQAIEDELASCRERGETHPIVAYDAPKRVLRRLIADNEDEKVGGTIQQAWATAGGFQIVSNMEPITPTPPSTRNAGLFLLGFDTFDLAGVGEYLVSSEGR